MEHKIQRFCWFDTVDFTGKRTTIWKYKRAIEGHKLVLVGINASEEYINREAEQFFQVYDGHTYSHWGSFPGIFDQSTLAMVAFSWYAGHTFYIPLNNWECKEVTMSMRNMDTEYARRFCAVLWFYEIPMSQLEKFEYAVKQPRYKRRHGGLRTLDRFED